MKLIKKFIIQKTGNDEKQLYHYELEIWKRTRHVMLRRNDLLLYDRQFFDDITFKYFKEAEERSLISLCLKHPEVISYSKLVCFDK